MGFSLLIANRDPEMASIISSELSGEGHSVSIVHDGLQLLDHIRQEDHHLLIMDFDLPGSTGVTVLEKIRKIRNPESLPVLILSSPLEDAKVVEALNQGASDFLFKPYLRDQFLSRVRALISRFSKSGQIRMEFKEGQYTFGKFRLNVHSYDFYQGETRTHLTPSEFKLLEALFRRQGAILTREDLIREVQGEGVVVIDRAIDTHVFSLRKKLGESSFLIETVRGIGYRLDLQSEK